MPKHTKPTRETPGQMLLLVELGLLNPDDLPNDVRIEYFRSEIARRHAYIDPEDLTPRERDDTN